MSPDSVAPKKTGALRAATKVWSMARGVTWHSQTVHRSVRGAVNGSACSTAGAEFPAAVCSTRRLFFALNNNNSAATDVATGYRRGLGESSRSKSAVSSARLHVSAISIPSTSSVPGQSLGCKLRLAQAPEIDTLQSRANNVSGKLVLSGPDQKSACRS